MQMWFGMAAREPYISSEVSFKQGAGTELCALVSEIID